MIVDVLPNSVPSKKIIHIECELTPETKNSAEFPYKVSSNEFIEISEDQYSMTIQQSKVPIGVKVLFQPKRDELMRAYVNYREVNDENVSVKC